MMAMALEQAEDHVVFTDPEGRIRYVNQAFVDVTGYSREEAIGQNPRILKSKRHPPEFYARMWGALERGESYRAEVLNRRKDGRLFYDDKVIAPVRDESGRLLGYIATGRDVSERKLTDPTTGLPNRLLLRERIVSGLERVRRDHAQGFSLVAIDLDRFTLINERFGLETGDRVLREVGERLSSCVRAVDTVIGTAFVGYLGGDGYLILLDGATTWEQVRPVVLRIKSCLAEAIDLGHDRVELTACVGVTYARPGDGPDEIIQEAASAVRRAQEQGTDQIAIYDPEEQARASARMRLESELRHAVAHGQLFLVYQPIYHVARGDYSGFEALVRWRHPERGVVPPVTFISALEETGLIVPAGRWILREACQQVRRWREAGHPDLTVAVNLSMRQFNDPELSEDVRAAIEEAGIEPGQLKLEITESMAASDPEETIARLTALKALGPQLLIDDFGTGYSSLSYLTRYPVDKLKVDRSFVMNLPGDRQAAVVADTIIAMAHKLGLGVIAEGVEDEAQLDFLTERSCDEIQGYYFSRPLEEAETYEALRERRAG